MCKSSVRSFDGDAAVRAADERLEEVEDAVEEEEPDEPVDAASDADDALFISIFVFLLAS